MDVSESKKWALISQITSFGWIIAVIATIKKERSNYLCCFLNNGLIIFIYGFVVTMVNEFYKNGIYSIGGGDEVIVINHILALAVTLLNLIVNVIYLGAIILGIVFAVKGEKRRIPYFFKISFFENLNVFKSSIEDNEAAFDSTNSHKTQIDSQKTFSETAHNFGKAAADFATGVFDTKKMVCPKCGRLITKDDTFCTYCGEEIHKETPVAKEEYDERITVSAYLNSIKTSTCEHCGEIISNGDKFCPKCGKSVEFKIKLDTCSKCGREHVSNFDFCPGCGFPIEKVVLVTNCKKCGAELLFGKAFCVNCGNKIYE